MSAEASTMSPDAPSLRLVDRLWDEAPIIALAILLFFTCFALMAQKGVYFGPELILLNGQVYFVSIVLMLALDFGWRLWKDRPPSPIEHFKTHYLTGPRRARMLAGLPMLAVIVSFMPFFSKMKAMIPLFNAYSWDATFIAWDQTLFFGMDGWEVLQPLFGHPPLTAFIALLYQLWMLLIYPGCLYFLFYPVDGGIRRRYFFGFLLSWTLIGGLMATLLASVGPVFLEELVGNPHFADQMAYLYSANEQVPVMTLKVQEMLLAWFHADARGLGSGITAMPSMHVAMAFLFWLAIREVNARAGWFFFAFLLAIFIGSIHLAYHYAVDGIVSILVVAAIWWISKPFFALWDRFAGQLRNPALPQPA